MATPVAGSRRGDVLQQESCSSIYRWSQGAFLFFLLSWGDLGGGGCGGGWGGRGGTSFLRWDGSIWKLPSAVPV